MTAEILVSSLQNLLALLFAGALLYWMFSQKCLEDDLVARLFLGGAFGVADLAMSLGSVVIDDVVVVNGSAGLIIFAAYLGGPVSGGITLLVTLAVRASQPLDMLPISITVNTAYMLGGLALRWLVPITAWPAMPMRSLPWAIAAFVVAQTLGALAALASGLLPAGRDVGPYLPMFYLLGAGSVAATWVVVRKSWQMAEVVRDKGELYRQLQLIFETCGIGSFHYSARHGHLDYDPSFLKLYGIESEPNPKPGEYAAQVTYPDDRPRLMQFIQGAVQGQSDSGTLNFRSYRVDGSLRHMRAAFKVDDGGRDITGLHMDVTDVVEAERRQAEAEHQVAAIAENVPGVIFQIIWKDGVATDMTYISPKATEIWGHTREELIADPYLTMSQYEDGEVDKIVATISEAVETGKARSVRVRLTDKAGKHLVVKARVQATPLENGSHLVNGIYIDVTREAMAEARAHEAEERANQAQKNESIGQLTGGVAHDFNNILAIILGNLELLREEIDDPKRLAEIDGAIAACQRGAGLTRSMLAFARKTPLMPEVLDLNVVVRQAGSWMRRALPESISVETNLLAGLWPVKIDPTSLESAFLNLLVNARDAMGGQGSLTVETANVRIDKDYLDTRGEAIAPGRYVMLAVSDTGTGIDKDTLKHIFEPFYTTKAPGAGSGIGLSMVQGFVQQSKGTVQVYSEVGVGTTFKLYFPVGDEALPDTTSAEHRDIGKGSGQGRILLVEDEEGVRNVMLTVLRNAGYDVTPAATGDTALDIFRSDPTFDLVVTDIVMPGKLQGTHLAKMIRAERADIPIIFMSGYATEATVHGNGLRHQDIRLMKPVPKATLLDAVATALADTNGGT